MICKKCGCDTFVKDGDLLVCAKCGAISLDIGFDFDSTESVTNQLNRLEEEAGTGTEEIQTPPPIEEVHAELQAEAEAEAKKAEEIEHKAQEETEPETTDEKNSESESQVAEKKNIKEENKKEKKEKKEKNKLKEAVDFCIPIVIAVIIAAILKTFVLANAIVPTGSMIPTINEKDIIIASRLAYISNDPERYDIIMFKFPDNESVKFVKRVLGVPGDTINVIDGKVYISNTSGQFAAEDSFVNTNDGPPTGTSGPFYIPQKGETITTDGSYCYAENGMNVGSTSFLSKYCDEDNGTYTVAENLYFCIGDNINISADSRAWTNKYVAESKILGKVVFKYYPKFEKFE